MHVISSTSLPDTDGKGTVQGDCPRTHLGLQCIKGQYQCLCSTVETTDASITRSDSGEPVAVNLIMKVANLGLGGPQAVITGIRLTGLRANLTTSKQSVTASFNLRHPMNHSLKTFVLEGP